MRKILPILLSLAFFSAFAEDFDHSSYKPSTLAAATEDLGIDPRADFWFDAAHPKYHVSAKFTGKTRPIVYGTKDFISRWAKAMGHPPEYAQIFTVEVEIEQSGAKYWMPIQSSLMEAWTKEMSSSKNANLYLLLMGAYNHVPVFAINSFSAGA